MKLYYAEGPSSRIVRMFTAEKKIFPELVSVNLIDGEHLQSEYLKKNSLGHVPCLEHNQKYFSETVAICEYLEELHPANPLLGRNIEERAVQRMWQRRIELLVTENIYQSYKFSFGLEIYRSRIHCMPNAAEDFALAAQKNLKIIDQLIENRTWVCGDYFSLADIILFCMLDFGDKNGQLIDTGLLNINVWFATMMTRNSTHSSLENKR